MDTLIHRDRLIRGARYFAVLTVAGLGILFVVTGGETWRVIHELSFGFMALAALAAVADTLLGASRYQVFIRSIRKGSSFWLPIRADLASRFVGAATPSQTGGGPAQVFVLHKGGVPAPEALSFLAINFLFTMVLFLAAGGFTAWMFRDAFESGTLRMLVAYGFVAFAAGGFLMILALVRPDLIERPCRVLADRLSRSSWSGGVIQRCLLWLVASVDQYREACTQFIRKDPIVLLWSLLLTVVLYANKFTLGYLVLRGMGVDAPYLEVIAVQALLQFILFVAPSPGGSGIAELTTAALMSRFMDAHLLGVFTVAFRLFLLYLPATLGCFVLIAELKPKAARIRAPDTTLPAKGAVAP